MNRTIHKITIISHAENETAIQSNVFFLTGIHWLLVTNMGLTAFPSANNCQGQPQTPQSVPVVPQVVKELLKPSVYPPKACMGFSCPPIKTQTPPITIKYPVRGTNHASSSLCKCLRFPVTSTALGRHFVYSTNSFKRYSSTKFDLQSKS
jgi:hypothetical protein